MFNHASYQRNEQDNRFAARLQFSFPDPGPLPEENNEKRARFLIRNLALDVSQPAETA
jgi:hypothetical protein